MRFFLIFSGILFGLCWLPLGIRGRYSDDGFLAWVLVGPFPVRRLPREEKEKKEKTGKPPKKTEKKPAKQEKKEKKGGSLRDFLPLLTVAKNALGSLRRKLRLRRLELKLIMAGDDPCDLALNYGKAWAAVGNLMPQLESLFVIGKRNIAVECDFTANETKVYVSGTITITLGRLVGITAKYGYQALREYFKLRKKRKGERKHE